MNEQTQYYGRPCKRGHADEQGRCLRWRASGQCTACQLAHARRYCGVDPDYADSRLRNGAARRAAVAAGEVHYHADPCRKCGSTTRLTSNYSCITCVRQRKGWRTPEQREREWRCGHPKTHENTAGTVYPQCKMCLRRSQRRYSHTLAGVMAQHRTAEKKALEREDVWL